MRVTVEDGVADGVDYYKVRNLMSKSLDGADDLTQTILLTGWQAGDSQRHQGSDSLCWSRRVSEIVDTFRNRPQGAPGIHRNRCDEGLAGVGENYHDHVKLRVSYTINKNDTYEYDWIAAVQYLANRTGPLSSTEPATIVGRLATSKTTNPGWVDDVRHG